MARTKLNAKRKGKKAPAKRNVKNLSSTVASLERDFKAAPEKIAGIYGKELTSLSKQISKLTNKLKKSQAQQQKAKDKFAALSAKPSSPALKKQLTLANKTLGQLSKDVTANTAELEQNKKLCETFEQKKAYYTALTKELSKLEKQLAKDNADKVSRASNNKLRKKTKKTKINESSNSPKEDIEQAETLQELEIADEPSDVLETEAESI